MGFLSGLFGGGKNYASDAAKKNKGIINTFDRDANQIINTGETRSAGAINQAIDGYQPYVDAGAGAVTMQGNALGLNGADGNAAATEAFQAGPGYQFAMDQGTQAALRGASASGMLASGNTLTGLSQFGQGLANQEYGGWLDRLSGLSSQGLAATGGQAGALGGLADLYQGTADDRLGVESTVAQGKMGANNAWATARGQEQAQKGSFFGNLLNTGLSIGTKLATGGLF